MGSLIRGTSLLGFTTLLEELGADPAEFMHRWQLPSNLASQPDAFYPYKTLSQMLETAALELACPDISMRLARKQGLDTLGPIAVIARNAETVADAFQAIGRYLYIHSPALHAKLEPPKNDGYYRLRLDIVETGLLQKRQVHELTLATGSQILRMLAGQQAHPTAVYFPHAPLADLAAYQAMFHCPIRFEQDWCGCAIAPALAERRIDSADQQTHQLATAYLETGFQAPLQSMAEQVGQLIRRLLPTGQCLIATVAEQMALHPRTLQRRLANENTSFEQLLDEVRRERASHYLGETHLVLSQVAGLLGYSEQSNFNRACRRWFDTTPKRYRLSAAG